MSDRNLNEISLTCLTNGKLIKGHQQCPSGKTTLVSTVNYPVKDVDITLESSILRFNNIKLHPNQVQACTCLVFNPNDFLAIQSFIHKGAFGSDYGVTEFPKLGERIVVWKIPKDLHGLTGYIPIPEPNDVGTYPLDDDDNRKFPDIYDSVGKDFTKIRQFSCTKNK